jgi:hypothetical protein
MKAAPDSKVDNEDAFDEMKQPILNLYRGVEAQHSFLVEDGQQVVDCIPIEQQPAVRRFGGPVLKPRPLPEGSPSSDGPLPGQLDPQTKDRFANAMACPDGTIPMRRITLDEMSRFQNVRALLQKSPLGGGDPGDAGTDEMKKYATAGWGNQPNNGGVSTLNLWNPDVLPPVMLQSLSQVWFYGGVGAQPPPPSTGWAAYPNLLRRPHSPNKNRGRLQIMVRRAVAYADADVLTATEVYKFCKTMPKLVDGTPLYRGARWSIVGLLNERCERGGRATTRGRPWLWRLKTLAADKLSATSD